MTINVYNNKELVYSGTTEGFIEENQGDEYVADLCAQLEDKDEVETLELSGLWKIKKVN